MKTMRRRRVAGLCVLVAACFGSGCAAPSGAGLFKSAAVAADHATASEAGAEILRAGGNAVDAAVATSFTLSVVRPESCGIGGGGFMVIRFSEEGAGALGKLGRAPASREIALNYREMCPGVVGPEYYDRRPAAASTQGGTAVAIPGTVAGLLYALDHYGTLDRAAVLAPAIRAAEHGFIADPHYTAGARELAAKFEKHPEWKTRFAFVWDRYLKQGTVSAGDRIKVPEQAAALRLIAERGAPGFYEGPVAEAILEAVRNDGGALTDTDLRSFKVSQTAPLTFDFMAWRFLTMPPPSSGGVAMGEALGIFERLPMISGETLRRSSPRKQPPDQDPNHEFNKAVAFWMIQQLPDYDHALVESLKHAFADRAQWLGDPAFGPVPTERLLSTAYLDARAATFDRDHTLPADRYGTRDASAQAERRDDDGTSHLSIVDASGTAVACTETINLGFGSCIAVPRYGFILNDQMDDFTTRRGKANAFGLRQSERNLPEPGKRPLSSMTPTIVLDEQNRVAAVAGASGGPLIISGTMQALINALLWGMPAERAVGAPRVHHQWSPDRFRLEHALFDSASTIDGKTMVEGLRARGHEVEPIDAVANVQLIKRTDNGWQAACDPRKGGRPAGY